MYIYCFWQLNFLRKCCVEIFWFNFVVKLFFIAKFSFIYIYLQISMNWVYLHVFSIFLWYHSVIEIFLKFKIVIFGKFRALNFWVFPEFLWPDLFFPSIVHTFHICICTTCTSFPVRPVWLWEEERQGEFCVVTSFVLYLLIYFV